jgi:alanine or glycine:cation symporter, AGCS family
VVCAATGIVVVNSGEWMTGLKGSELTSAAFADVPVIGPAVLTFGLLTFVFSTILGWSYYGEKAMEYLFGKRAVMPYRWAWVAAVMVGSVASLHVVWTFADIANALMALPNLVSLLLLSPVIASDTKHYFSRNS